LGVSLPQKSRRKGQAFPSIFTPLPLRKGFSVSPSRGETLIKMNSFTKRERQGWNKNPFACLLQKIEVTARPDARKSK